MTGNLLLWQHLLSPWPLTLRMDGTLWSVSVSTFLSSFIALSWFPLYSYVIVNMLVQDEALESRSILIHFKLHYSKFFKDAAERSEVLYAQW